MAEIPSYFRENIHVQYKGQTHEVLRGMHLNEFLEQHGGPRQQEIIAAFVNNRLNGRFYPLRSDCTVRPVTRNEREGWDAFRRSVCLMLYEAARRYDPTLRLVLSGTLGDGYFYYDRRGQPISRETIDSLERTMHQIVQEDLPFRVTSMSVIEARKLCLEAGFEDKAHLLDTHWEPNVRVAWCGEFFDLFHKPLAYSTGRIQPFKLEPYEPGMVLRFPRRGGSEVRATLKPHPKLFAVYQETRRWNEILGMPNVGALNGLTLRGDLPHFIHVAEGFHEKKIATIADEICRQKDRLRVVLIAGPSASGKTTFSKRLGVQLQVNEVQPVNLSVDDFFVPREQTPKDSDGNYDFEHIEALNLELLWEVLVKLLKGEEVLTPVFDFQLGSPRPENQWRPMRLERDQILIIEGIHGLNDRLTQPIPKEMKIKLYVSALTQLAIDDHNRIHTSDTRLLRRIIRDRQYRGYSAGETIMRWPSVRRGEDRHIFPFQEQADAMFNSALAYEHAVLRPYAERFLLEVTEEHPAFSEVYRLLRFLRLILPVVEDAVPQNSILREFIGKSTFHY
ncbi:MAG: nucleoside kinase [Bradymonadales bacterium]|nr:nucleoside kinase [Bradymonadales bacterium]